MAYGWNVNNLYSCRQKLMDLLKHCQNDEEARYISIILGNLNIIIEDIHSKGHIPELSYNERLEVIEKELVKFAPFYDIADDFIEKVFGFNDQMTRIENIFRNVIGPTESFCKITGATLTNEYAFQLTKEFYKQFDPVLLPTFLKAYDTRRESVTFVRTINGQNQGTSFYVDLLNKYFIAIVKTNDLNKLFTLVHEFGHVLSYMINPKRYTICEDDMYDEVPAVFPELLALELNVGNFHPTHIAFEKYASLVNVYNIGNNLAMHLPYVDIWKDNGRDAESDEFARDIKEEFDEEKEDIDESLDTYIDSCGTYLIAYITSIELLNLYRRDKKKALEIYRNIISVPYTESTHDYVTSELTLGSHIEEETSVMLDDMEKRLKKVGAFHV